MTKVKKEMPGEVRLIVGDGLRIDVSDGLRKYTFDEWARHCPNAAEGTRWRKWHEADFAKMLRERDSYVEQLLEGYLPKDASIKELHETLVSTAPFTVGYYAVKYMLHRKLADHFLQQDHDFSVYREIYLLGETWAEARFMANHRHNAIDGRKQRERNRQKGKKSKQRSWAHLLAAHIVCWDEIPDSYDEPMIIETLETELRFYRDADSVVCVNKHTGRVAKLARTTFEKRYLIRSPRGRGQ